VLIASEYDKYLAAWIRQVLDAINPASPAVPPVMRASGSGSTAERARR